MNFLRKIRNFTFILIGNIVLFTIIELVLRSFEVGYSTGLFTESKIDAEEFLSPNKLYAAKYFASTNLTVPAPNPYLFRKEKPDSVFRIFVIGESTSRGFPYSKTESFPAQMEQLLAKADSSRSFEVINLSMDATNSYTGLQVAREAARYDADLVVFYYGNNEFIGIGGSGSNHNSLFRINESLSELRLYQVCKGIVSHFKKEDKRALIERMAKKGGVDLSSETYQITLADFEKHYREMVQIWRQKNVPVIACGVVRNLKDFKPSEFAVDKETVSNIFSLINDSLQPNKVEKLKTLANNRADYNYTIGKALLMERKPELAKEFLESACDLDPLRLRASTDINKTIEKICNENNCNYFDVQKYMDSIDSEGIAGNRELVEHVHPVLDGQTLIAGKMANLTLELILHKSPVADSTILIPASMVEKMATVKILKNLFTKYPLADLKYFNPVGFESLYTRIQSASNMQLRSEVDKAAFNELEMYFQQFSEIDQIHLKYGMWLYKQDKANDAYAEFLLAYKQNPWNVIALNNMSIIRFVTGDKPNAIKMLNNACTQTPEYKTGLTNLWLMYNYNQQTTDANRTKSKLTKLGVDLKGITSFIMEEI